MGHMIWFIVLKCAKFICLGHRIWNEFNQHTMDFPQSFHRFRTIFFHISSFYKKYMFYHEYDQNYLMIIEGHLGSFLRECKQMLFIYIISKTLMRKRTKYFQIQKWNSWQSCSLFVLPMQWARDLLTLSVLCNALGMLTAYLIKWGVPLILGIFYCLRILKRCLHRCNQMWP